MKMVIEQGKSFRNINNEIMNSVGVEAEIASVISNFYGKSPYRWVDSCEKPLFIKFKPSIPIDPLRVMVNKDCILINRQYEHDNIILYYFEKNESFMKNSSEFAEMTNDFKIIEEVDTDARKSPINENGRRLEGYILYHLQNNVDPTKAVISYRRKGDRVINIYPIDKDERPDTEIRIGRFVNKIIELSPKYKFKPTDIEKYVSKYSSIIMFLQNIENNFEVVSGEDIRKWYNEENYETRENQLGGSCMRFKKCEDFLNIYVDNPETCSMLILRGTDRNKIIGRALLWKLKTGETLMDRIYYTKDNYRVLFEEYAKKKGYIRFGDNISQAIVCVKPTKYSTYPYMDTFHNYIPSKGLLLAGMDPRDLSNEVWDTEDASIADTVTTTRRNMLVLTLRSTDGNYGDYNAIR